MNRDNTASTAPNNRTSRRYERLIRMLLHHDLLDMSRLEKRAMLRRVSELSRGYTGKCHAMARVAGEFNCSYEKVRNTVYNIKKPTNFTTMNSTIKIKNEREVAIIDIEGTIGLSESWQYDNPESRVATYEEFKECVSRIADIRNAHIRVNIRSTGGDVNDAMLIYEALKATGAHVTTCCYGYTASAATIVAQAASEGCRLIAPTSLYLIHNSLCSVEGNAEELQAEVELLRQTDLRIAEIYARHSGRSVEEIAALMAENCGKGRWLSPAEVVEWGLADTVDNADCEEPKHQVERSLSNGVKALLSAIGIDVNKESIPDVNDDVNYIPHNVVPFTKQPSVINFEEQQLLAKPTTLKSVDDPTMRELPSDDRKRAYDSDAKSMRQR